MTVELSKPLVVTSVGWLWPFQLPIWHLRGEDVVIAETRSTIPWLQKPLSAVADLFVRAGFAKYLTDVAPDLDRYNQGAGPEFEHDVFRRIESWMNDYFGFEEMDRRLGQYGYVFRHITCNFIQKRLTLPVVIEAINNLPGQTVSRFAGFEAVVNELAAAYCDRGLAPFQTRPAFLNRLVNSVIGTLYLISALGGILGRTRAFQGPAMPVKLAADFIADPRDRRIYDAAKEFGSVYLVPRDGSRLKTAMEDYPEFPIAGLRSGRFGMAEAAMAGREAIRDSWTIFKYCGAHSPEHYAAIAKSVYKRMRYRAFFRRYSVSAYWCRDDYNPDHIIRSQELRRIGGRSLGLNHGYAILAEVVPHYRYIDYDVYYTFGLHLYEKHYKDTWPASMRVHASGCFAMSQPQLAQRDSERPDDIAIFLKFGYWPGYTDPQLVQLVHDVAAAFPERRVMVKFKGAMRHLEAKANAGAEWQSQHQNVIIVAADQDPYELLSQVSYLVSDPSSIVAEAINFGIKSFVLDFKSWKSLVFRDFPDLCVNDGPEFIHRITGMESGDWRYPVERFEGLIAPQTMTLADRVIKEVLVETPDQRPPTNTQNRTVSVSADTLTAQ